MEIEPEAKGLWLKESDAETADTADHIRFLEGRLREPVFQPPQLKPNPQLTHFKGKSTLKLNPEKAEQRVKQKLRGPRSKRIEEMRTLTPWLSHPETPAKKMQLRGRAKPAQEKPDAKEEAKASQRSAAEELTGKKPKVTFNEAVFMQPLNVDLPGLTQEATTDDARHHMHKAEVMSGMRRGATANGEETFRQICDLLKIPKLLEDAYYEWLMHSKRPGPVFDRETVPRCGSRVKPGTRLPRPDGS